MRAEDLRANGISQCEGLGKPEQQFPSWISWYIGDTGMSVLQTLGIAYISLV
jgi:hypothetical protein